MFDKNIEIAIINYIWDYMIPQWRENSKNLIIELYENNNSTLNWSWDKQKFYVGKKVNKDLIIYGPINKQKLTIADINGITQTIEMQFSKNYVRARILAFSEIFS